MAYSLIENIAYGTHERQKVDLFLPDKVKSENGIIFYIHGGGWSDGDKACHHVDCKHFCELGYICASMNYRFVSEDISVFEELDDIGSALSAVKYECEKNRISINRAILSGGSAGGHLALLYAYLRKEKTSITPVAACVYCPAVNCSKADFLFGISAEFDEWKYGLLSKCCGVKVLKESFFNDVQQSALKKISPVEYVADDSIPVAIFHGKKDELVPLEHTLNFLEQLDKMGVKNELLIYENSGHALDMDPDCSVKSLAVIEDFAVKYL